MYNWTVLEPRHLGSVDELHDEQQKRLNIAVDRPCMVQKPILLSMGLEDENGKLLGGFYIEATAELCFIGTSREVTEAAIEKSPEIYQLLQGMGIRWLRCNVPKKRGLLALLRGLLDRAGFYPETKLVMFSRDLRRKAG
jgi:hypothetical protein